MTTPSTSTSGCATFEAPPQGDLLGAGTPERLARVFKALGDPTRVRLLSLIAENGEACICDLTDCVSLSQPTVSHHMKLLADAGLVLREQRGKWAYYRVVDGTMRIVAQAVLAVTTTHPLP